MMEPMAMEMKAYTGGELMCHGYLVIGEGGECVAIDAPGGFAAWAVSQLPAGARLSHLLLTHQHFDHIEDAAALQQATGCTIHACRPYNDELTLASHAASWGIPAPAPFHVDDALGTHDSTARWAGLNWAALHIPGHASDGMVYSLPEAKLLFVGDVLFEGSIGRTDMPGGSMAQLVRGIRSKIMILPPETRVLPGHGPATSVGEEELNNPFIQG